MIEKEKEDILMALRTNPLVQLDISVLITTHNRDVILRETLQAMTELDRDHLCVEWIIIDNNSSDHTRQIVESFQNKLPLKYLFEPRPGKNCALNKALRECNLGEIVVFTDDDVTPERGWLREIVGVCDRWPNDSVFGGRIDPLWPSGVMPQWAKDNLLQQICFAKHNEYAEERPYLKGTYPFGGNMWMRGSVLRTGPRYDERLGPRPSNRLMGSETSFLIELDKDGLRPIYSPRCVVSHRITASSCKLNAVLRRGYRFGRSQIRLHGPDSKKLLANSKILWLGKRFLSLSICLIKIFFSFIYPTVRGRVKIAFYLLMKMGRNIESLRVVLLDDKLK